MKLIIDLPDEVKTLFDNADISDLRDFYDFNSTIGKAIKNGTPLPKGHGRLIDADALIEFLKDTSKRQKYKDLLLKDSLTVDDVFKAFIETLQNKGLAEGDTPTIIEADKESD